MFQEEFLMMRDEINPSFFRDKSLIFLLHPLQERFSFAIKKPCVITWLLIMGVNISFVLRLDFLLGKFDR